MDWDSLLEQIEERISRLMPSRPSAALLYGMIRYHMGWVDADLNTSRSDPGKRVRSRLALLSCAGAGSPAGKALAPATAVELIHNFSLVHDDIQDKSEFRRHRRSVWAIWGASQAINAGDAIFALAQLALAEDEESDPSVVVRGMRELNRACRALCEGQVLDLGFEERVSVSTEEYYAMIEGKTAALLSASCHLGALYAGASDETADHFGRFGKHLGLAFQVRDDYLGIWGDQAETGKPSAADLTSKKKTLPLLYALSKAAGPDRESMETVLSTAGRASERETHQLLAVLDRTGAADHTAAEVARHTRAALDALDDAAPKGEAGAELAALCQQLTVRTR